jgi:hypothetical protein
VGKHIGVSMMKLASGYTTSELRIITDFLERSLAIQQEQIAELSGSRRLDPIV